MKKIAVCIFMFFSLSLHAEGFRISAGTGLFNGKINEYVFDETCKNTDNILSELNWHIDNLLLFDVNAAYYLFNDFFFSADFKIAVPKNTYSMTDSDWLDDLNPYERSKFSEHPCDIKNYFLISGSLGKKICINDFFNLEPFGLFSFDYIDFHSYDGYKIYKDEGNVKTPMYGNIIDYTQLTLSFFAGCNAVLYKDKSQLFASLALSPFLTWCDCYDLHWKTGPSYYNDEVYFSFRLKLELGFIYSFYKGNSICTFINYDFSPRQKGRTLNAAYNDKLDRYSQYWNISSAEGGTSRSFTVIGINYKYIFDK